MSKRHERILIIGGGTAGVTVGARLRRAGFEDVTILEPSDTHWYQPLFTLVGGGMVPISATSRPQASVNPPGVQWHRDAAVEIDPEKRTVLTRAGTVLHYDLLVAAPGIELNWQAIPGLSESLGTRGVTSNYTPALAGYTASLLSGMTRGQAVFTSPSTPVKCGGAWQKIVYLAADQFRHRGVLPDVSIVACTPGSSLFGIDEYRVVLEELAARYGVDTRFGHELTEVDADHSEAIFTRQEPGGESTKVRVPYDVLHVVPPQRAPEFIRTSPLARRGDPLGWIDVDQHTLRHERFPEVFALGDAAGTPNGKTGAAVRKQAPVVVENMLAVVEGREPVASYGGYTSCPLVTARHKVLLAEFDYTMRPHPTIPLLRSAKERRSMWLLKRYGLPWMYWNLMLRGRA